MIDDLLLLGCLLVLAGVVVWALLRPVPRQADHHVAHEPRSGGPTRYFLGQGRG